MAFDIIFSAANEQSFAAVFVNQKEGQIQFAFDYYVSQDVNDIKTSLKEGNDRFRRQEKLNSMFIAIMLAFVDFEIAYCHNTGYKDNADLLKAKRLLQKYLTGQENYDHEED